MGTDGVALSAVQRPYASSIDADTVALLALSVVSRLPSLLEIVE